MITENPYDNPQKIGYLAAILDGDKTIGFRKLDGSFLPLIGDVTQADIEQAVTNALHDLESAHGLQAFDGSPKEAFPLHFELDSLRHVADQLTAKA